MSRGNYKEIAFTNFAGGLDTRIDSNQIQDNESPDLQNVIFDGQGYIAPRLGSEIFGSATSASGKIRSTWVTNDFNDVEVPIRQVDNTTTSWLEYYNAQTADWENLDAGFTTGHNLANSFYDYYTYFCSQKDSQWRWSGNTWATSTYADSAYSRIDLSTSAASALGFLSAGSVVIGGTELYYSSISATALSGITFAAALNGGLAVAQLPTSAGEVPSPDGGWTSASSGLPKGSIMYEMDAQMFVAGASGVSGNIVYYSAVNEPTNYTISATPGGGGSSRYPETTGGITGLTEFDEVLTVLKQNTIRKLIFNTLSDGTAGTLEIVDRKNIITGSKIGSRNNKTLSRTENDVVFVSPSGWVKSLSKTQAGQTITNEMSIKIRPLVEDLVFTNSSGVYFDGKYYLTCATATATFNNVVLVYDYGYGAWTRFVGWNVSDWFIYNNTLYYGASNEIATYRALTTYADNDYAYESYWTSKQFDFGVPSEQKRLALVYVEGYITENSKIGVSAYFNGNTASPQAKTIDGASEDYVNADSSDVITDVGYNTWGRGTYGGGSSGGTYNLRKFRVYLRYTNESFYNLQIKVGSSSPGFVWRITHIAPYLNQVPGVKINPNIII